MEGLTKLTGVLNDTIYTWILIPLLLFVGILFTSKLKCGQFTHLKHVCKLLTEPPKEEKNGEKGISPFKAFTISAASHIGTGNF